jgi:predicted adenylyl cyclase CyaB
MANEYEIKFSSVNREEVVQKLVQNGFECTQKEYTMKRKTFHHATPKDGEFFRVRKEADKVTLTYKHIREQNIVGIEELEVVVSHFEAASEILLKAGLVNTSTQENKREIWRNTEIEICIDTWPGLKPYIEIEWPNPEYVEKYAKLLWYNLSEWLFGWSEAVYEKELWIPKEVLIKLPNISFQAPPTL